MEIYSVGLNSSSFNYSLGHLGKNTEKSNPNPISIFDFFDITYNLGFGGVEFPFFRYCDNEKGNGFFLNFNNPKNSNNSKFE